MIFAYSFVVVPLALPADWREAEKSPSLIALWELCVNLPRVRMDMTEGKFTAFREGLLEAGYKLEEIERLPLPPKPEPIA